MTDATPWSPQGGKDKFNLDDFAYLGSPNKRLPIGIDYDSFEGVSSNIESPKRSKAADGSVWTPRLNLPGTPINFNNFMDSNSGFTPMLQQKGGTIPVLNSANIPSSNDWAKFSTLHSNGTHGTNSVHTTTADPFSADLSSPPPRKGIKKKYEENSMLSPGFMSGGSAISDGGSFRVLDDLDSSSTGISLFNKTTTMVHSPKLGIAERQSEQNLSSPGLDSLCAAGDLILSCVVPPPPDSPNGIQEDQIEVKKKGSKKKEGGSSVKKEKKSRKKNDSPDGGLKIDTEDGSPPKIPQVTCSCRKTRCLKMYCDCFRFSKFCWEKCNCIKDGSEGSCCNQNVPECIIERDKAIKAITDRNPTAFNAKIVKGGSEKKEHLSGCHCKNSKCLKKYCECYTAMVPCSERCRCMNCHNTISNPDLKYEQPSHITAAYNEVEGVMLQDESSFIKNSQDSMNSGVTTEPEELTPSMNMNRIDINEEKFFTGTDEIACKENGRFPTDQSPPEKPNFEDGERKREAESEIAAIAAEENETMDIAETTRLAATEATNIVSHEDVKEKDDETSCEATNDKEATLEEDEEEEFMEETNPAAEDVETEAERGKEQIKKGKDKEKEKDKDNGEEVQKKGENKKKGGKTGPLKRKTSPRVGKKKSPEV